jgi:hypothetical protein
MSDTLVYLMRLHATHGWVQFALPLAAIAFWVVVAGAGYISSARETGRLTPGFKGLMAVFVAVHLLTPLRAALGFALQLGAVLGGEPRRHFGAEGVFPRTEQAMLGLHAVDLVFALVSLVAMLRMSRRFPTIFEVQYYWYVASILLSVPLAAFMMNAFDGAAVAPADVVANLLDHAREWAAIVLVGGIWLAYLRKSQRAALTFAR